MKLGVLKEADGETRVAIVPGSIKKLNKIGFTVLVESGAGQSSHHRDSEYTEAGATVTDRATALSADIVISIGMPELDGMKEGQMVACVSDPFRNPGRVKSAIDAKITLFSISCT
jgi:NAD(P) transhydrogenase subunit alpha